MRIDVLDFKALNLKIEHFLIFNYKIILKFSVIYQNVNYKYF